VDTGQEVSGGFVIAGCDRPELLEFAEEILDEMTRLVEMLVIVSDLFAVLFGWNDSDFSRCGQRLKNALISVVAFIGYNSVGAFNSLISTSAPATSET
jgi:hypothetical protein